MTAEPTPSSKAARRKNVPPIRTGTANRLPWVTATGPASVRRDKAIYYLTQAFDHAEHRQFDKPVMALAKVVCNLRHYFRQDQESTVRLIQKHYNPKSDYQWSEEGIRLTWDRVAPFTPFLGFVDVDAQSKRRVADLEDDVIDLIAFTRSGGQASTKELFATFKAWHPDLEVDPRVFGKAVKAATGINTKSSNSERYYEGFHLPSPEELMDTAHTPGALQSEAVEVTAPIRERGAA